MAESNYEGEGEATVHYPFSRCSSTGSIHAMNTSSANTTDDEDSDMGAHISIKDRRREAHTQAEQKRRDSIKKGYDALQDLVPMCQNSDNTQSYKVSKATVLQKSVDYIHYMQNCKKKQEEEVAALKKEVMGMTILKLNYEQIVSAHQNQPGSHSRQVSDDVKFEVFRAFIDSLSQTFDLSVAMNNFGEVSGSVIQWVEEHCKPQILREVMNGVLCQLQQHDYANPSTSATSYSLPNIYHPIVNAPRSNIMPPGLSTNPCGSTVINSLAGCTIAPVLNVPVCLNLTSASESSIDSLMSSPSCSITPFRAFIDSLSQTFDLSVAMNNFGEVSGSVIQWVEEHCKPQILREVMNGVLCQLQQHDYANPSTSATSYSLPNIYHPIVNAPRSNIMPPGLSTNPCGSTVINSLAGCTIAPVLNVPVCLNLTSASESSIDSLMSSPSCSITPVRTMPGSLY